MSIVGAFPNTLQNGTLEDATQVMALFAYIQAQVNGNACPATSTSSILKGDGSGGTSPAVAGTDFLVPAAGMVFDFAGSSIPSGYLACDGSAVSRTTYATLFTALGTTWGAGDGSTTFNVPDFRRRTTIGAGGTAVSGPANTLGAVGGEEKHTLTTAELAAHNHTINITDPTHGHVLNDPTHNHSSTTGVVRNISPTATAFNVAATAGNIDPNNTSGTTNSATGITMNNASTGITAASVNAGSGTPHNVMQPSAVVNKIIKT